MRIGVDYYPEHWEEERWTTDARLMRQANISVVRLAEFAWCKMEPHEEDFHFTWLDRALDILHAEGIQVVLGTPTATPPAWLHERFDIYPRDVNRQPLEFGTRLQRCLNHPVMRRYSRRITEKMVSRYANHPAVIGWQTDNEFEANICYCEICAERFREWLKRKYGTLENLNSSWGTIFWSQEYTGWSQIPLPWRVKCGESHNPSLKLEYRRFASQATVDFQHEQIEIIRRLAPKQFITHNLMGLHDTMDYFQLAKDLDFVAWDNYPGGSWMDVKDVVALPHTVMRGIKKSNFWVMEEQTHIVGWEEISRRPADGESRMWAWEAVAHGADTVVFFRWRSCLYGTEQYWHGVLNHDGQPRRRYREIQRFGAEMKKLSSELDGTVIHCDAAILNSYEENWSLQIQKQTNGLGWWEQTRRYYNALFAQGVNCDIISLDTDISGYKFVIAPSWYLLSEEHAVKLKKYVTDGGTLLLSPRTGVKNEMNVCRADCLPTLLKEAAGIEVDDYDPLGDAHYNVKIGEREETVSVWADAILLRGAQAVGVYTSGVFAGEAAITRHTYGKGTCYYSGVFGEPGFYDAVLPGMLKDSGISGRVSLSEGVDSNVRIKDGAEYLFLINSRGEEVVCTIKEEYRPILGPELVGTSVTLPAYEVGIYKK